MKSERFPPTLHTTPTLRRTAPAWTAFSIIELVVVMGIITLLVSVGAHVFSGGSEGTAVATAASTVSSAISGARQLAVSSNRRTRFIILSNNEENPENWRLRRFAVLQEVAEVSKSSSYFKMVTALDELRPGVFFQRDRADSPDAEGDSASMFDTEKMRRFPLQNTPNAEYAYIEFLPTGATSRASVENIFMVERAVEPGRSLANNQVYARIGVAQHTGRVKVERPN